MTGRKMTEPELLAFRIRTLKMFVRTVEELGELLETSSLNLEISSNYKKHRVYAKSVPVHIFLEFRKLKNENQSYQSIVKQLKKCDLGEEANQFLSNINSWAKEIDDTLYAGGVKFGLVDEDLRTLTNINAFNELESTYITHSDRKQSPIRAVIPNDIPSAEAEFIYFGQVLGMVKDYYNKFLYRMKEYSEEVIIRDGNEPKK